MRKILLLFVFLNVGVISIIAENEIEFHGGLAIPEGDFKSQSLTLTTAGGAVTGVNFGVKLMHQILIKHLYLDLGVDFFYNKISSSTYNNDYITMLNSPKYTNFPMVVGLTYQQPVLKKIKIWEEIGCGLNISRVSSEDIDWHYNGKFGYVSGETYDEYKSAKSFCYRFGVGFLFLDRFSVGCYYHSLGNPTYSNTHWQEDEDDGVLYKTSSNYDKKLKIRQITLNLGIRLFTSKSKKLKGK